MATLTGRRGSALLAALLGTALALTGCNASNPDSAESSTAASSDGTFPVTIETAYGEITVNEKPERIAVLGDTFLLEPLSILGETASIWSHGATVSTRAGVLEWLPWYEGIIDGDPDPSLFNADNTVNVEAVAASAPDLILTNIWNVDESVYEQLSEIAPTYAGIETDATTSWQDNLASLAQLTGHDPGIVNEAESEYAETVAAAKERLPGLQGKTFIAAATDDDAVFWLCDYPNEAIENLGLVPHQLQASNGEGCDGTNYSWERLDEFTADVVFFVTEHRDPSGETQARLEADPRLSGLPAANNGTLVQLSPASLWSAINGVTPASFSWWLEQDIISQLESSALNQAGQ